MAYEQMWVAMGLVWLAVGGALFVWARHLREAKRLAVREMIHKERMAALERGVTVDALPGPPEVADPRSDAVERRWWLESSSLLAGLVLVFGGLGMGGGFLLLNGDEVDGLHQLAGLGLIPVLVGVGLLLFHGLHRRASGRREDG